MTNRQKNNFNERIKRLGGGQLPKPLRDRNPSKRMHFTSMGELPKEVQEQTESGKTEEMFDFMKKELDMLMAKSEEAEKERKKMSEEMATLANKIGEKDKESAQLTRDLEQSRNSVHLYKKKLEEAESQLENMRLRQKMETISKEITQEITLEKQPAASVKHLKHQKGKFSKAGLPPAFGSQKKIEFHSTNLMKEQEVGGVQSLLRNPFSGFLIDEWQKTHNERNYKELEIATLEGKIASLKKEIGKQSKEIQQIKAQKPTRQELVAANDRIRLLERKERTLLVKLKESQKRKEVSMIKEKGDITQEDEFYGISTIADINNMIQKGTKSLEIQSNAFQLVVSSVAKTSTQAQTQDNEEKNEPMNPLLEVVNELQQKLKQKQLQFSSQCLELKDHYQNEIHQCILELESQRAKIQQYSQMLQSVYSKDQRQCSSVGVECHLSKEKQFQNRENILEKVKLLIQVNEQCISTIYKLRTENQQLSKQLDFFNKRTNFEERSVQVQIEHFFQEEEQDIQCPGCKSLKQEVYSERQQVKRLTKIIQVTTSEGHHFKHCYQEILTSYRQLENDSQREINKLRAQFLQKEKSLLVAESDLEQITFEMERYKSEFVEIQEKLREESLILRESFDC